MANRFCPCSPLYDDDGDRLPGPHNFNWAEGLLMYCSGCGETRVMDPEGEIPEDDSSYILPDPGPMPTPANKPNNGIFP